MKRYSGKLTKLMQEKITQEDIILYIYNELETEKKIKVVEAISNNQELLGFYQETLILLDDLKVLETSPNPTIVNILREESRSNSLEMH